MDDNSLMSFGKHRGKKLKNVPASYFLWLYEQEWADEQYHELLDYIENNLDSIEEDAYNEGEKYGAFDDRPLFDDEWGPWARGEV